MSLNRIIWSALAAAIAGVALAGVGCAGAGRSADGFQPEVVEPTRAVLYIYREPRFGGKPVRVFVNQDPVGELRPGQYMVWIVTPGSFLVRAEGQASAARQVVLREGDAAYLRITGNAKPVVDRFHVAKLFNEATDGQRKKNHPGVQGEAVEGREQGVPRLDGGVPPGPADVVA